MYNELVKRLREVAEEVDNDYDVDPHNAEQRCLAILEAADVRPVVRGKWIINGWSIRCSECRYDMLFSVRNFCPNCGADMREES